MKDSSYDVFKTCTQNSGSLYHGEGRKKWVLHILAILGSNRTGLTSKRFDQQGNPTAHSLQICCPKWTYTFGHLCMNESISNVKWVLVFRANLFGRHSTFQRILMVQKMICRIKIGLDQHDRPPRMLKPCKNGVVPSKTFNKIKPSFDQNLIKPDSTYRHQFRFLC